MRYLVTGIARVMGVLAILVVVGVSLDRGLGYGLPGTAIPRFVGALVALGGILLEAWAIRTMWRRGRGTPHPAMPPEELVTSGPYARSRNPLYVARIGFLVGVALLLGSPGTLLMSLLLLLIVRFVIVPREESKLRSRFGQAFEAYAHHVPRWFGRRGA